MNNLNLLKKSLLTMTAMACFTNANAQDKYVTQHGQLFPPNAVQITAKMDTRSDDPQDDMMQQLLACPENTVHGFSYLADGTYSTGTMGADESRDGMSSIFYQQFESNYYKINGVRFYGLFNYYDGSDWVYCNDRGAVDADGNFTEPIKIRIRFKKNADNGMPGETVFDKIYDVIPTQTGIQIGNVSDGYTPLYAFDIDLGEEVKMESGYIGFSAADLGEDPGCWLSVFTSLTSQGVGMIGIENDTEWISTFGPACFCLKGTGEMSAKKSIKLNRFLSPSTNADGKYEKVGVEITNVGSESISGVELELWHNGVFVCKDKIDETIQPITNEYNGTFKHMFSKRVDCSAAGDNEFEIVNVTPTDEKFCDMQKTLKVKVYADGEVVESVSNMSDYIYITHVQGGAIDNESTYAAYNDFSDMKTELKKGEQLTFTVETKNNGYTAMWIDWNNNGIFSDNNEFIGYVNPEDYTINVNIPEEIDIKPGDKRMRLVSVGSWMFPESSGTYDLGETEDYTITVVRNDATAGIVTDADIVELSNNSASKALTITNEGTAELSATAYINYILPGSPDGMNVSHSTEKVPEDMIDVMKTAPKMLKAAVPAPLKDVATQYVLGYDRNPKGSVSMLGGEGTFAQLFPSKMLKDIAGMQISSVDVFISDVPGSANIIIYEENKNSNLFGKVLVDQSFVPQANSWNRIVLDEPITIDGTKGFVVSVHMLGMEDNKYYMGVDNSDAVVGYGDLAGFNGYWWSMADLGVNSNYCIRANVTGDKTPAISWLDADKKEMNIASGSNDALNLNYNGTEVDNYLYSAVIEFATNDELRQTVRIPVYFINDVNTGIISAQLDDADIVYANDEIRVSSKKEIFNISIYDVNGQLVENIDPEAGETVISTLNYNKGIYVISVMYSDGNRQGVKIPVIR